MQGFIRDQIKLTKEDLTGEKLEELMHTCGNQDHQGTQQHGFWQLCEGTKKTP